MEKINCKFLLLFFISTAIWAQKADLEELDFLVGTWKMEGKDNYENWIKSDNKLIGKSFKLINGQEKVSETIEITLQENHIVYTPTVFDQNDAKGIPFILESAHKKNYSFENPDHDFPKKIQYKILSKSELLVTVLGENDKGFSFKLIRLEK